MYAAHRAARAPRAGSRAEAAPPDAPGVRAVRRCADRRTAPHDSGHGAPPRRTLEPTPAPLAGAPTSRPGAVPCRSPLPPHPRPAPPAPERPDSLPQDFGPLLSQDPEIAGILLAERDRQAGTLQLIAAENFTSPAVLAALGSPLANKYAEGYPGARHQLGGCEYADAAERVAVRRATALFGAEHANVQPHSGSSAVLAAYAALLRPGDTVLAMGLPYGGHLTHGAPGNFSGR
ncbi:Serine hydroxymethyltransferase [Streptomyces badius]